MSVSDTSRVIRRKNAGVALLLKLAVSTQLSPNA